jgi:hypothetical protein
LFLTWFIYKIETGYGNENNANDLHHGSMTLDPDYRAMLMEIFPGHENEIVYNENGTNYYYYDLLVYAGTARSPAFDMLSQSLKDAIQQFLGNNGFY